MLNKKSSVFIIFGIHFLILQDPTEDEMALLNENPLFVLIEMMKVLEFRLVDLFHVLDKDHSKSISIDEFKEGLEVSACTMIF